VDGTVSQHNKEILAQIAEARRHLQEREADLQGVDGELAALAPDRERHRLLEQACSALERLRQDGAGELFWGEAAQESLADLQLWSSRQRLTAFDERVGALEARRRTALDAIAASHEALELLGEDLWDAEQQELRRREEWLVERDVGPLPKRVAVMPWSRSGEDDWRFRKALAASVLLCALLGGLLPLVDLPLPSRDAPFEIPHRLVQLVREEQAKPVPPKPVEAPEPKPEQKVEQPPKETQPKPEAKPGPERPEQKYAAKPQEQPVAKPGLLAFRDTFASLAKDDPAPKLGADARISDDEPAPNQPQRSMLTTNAPGSSGGINLSSLSRNVGGGGGGGAGALAGVQVGRASSSIGGGGSGGGGGNADRPRAGAGGSASRTDEEIQIVFDRYKASLYRLYNRELRKDPSLRGQMVLKLTIEPDGSVSMCAVQASDMNAPELSTQVVDRVRAINFGAKDVSTITILYPIDFLPAA
jgi:outer membrane biosynthesis protein TonB